jgi:hypothetical protein
MVGYHTLPLVWSFNFSLINEHLTLPTSFTHFCGIAAEVCEGCEVEDEVLS